MIARSRRFAFTAWWRTVDKLMLAALLVVMLAGIVLSLAASPPVAARLGLDPFYFVNRHVLYLIPAVAVMLGTSLLSPRQIRRVALIVFAVSFAMVIGTLFFGAEIKGARRWLIILGVNIQPSEFLKPAFVILTAWLFAESASKPDVPANAFAIVLLLATIVVLVAQPDFGQTTLIALVWGALFFMAGMRFIWVIGLTGVAAGGLIRRHHHDPARCRAYQTLPRSRFGRHVSSRHRGKIIHARRMVRPWPWRRHDQTHTAGQPRRLRVRGRGRGVWHRAVSCARRIVCFHCAACAH